MINHVHFAPGGRTHWHTHETGQVLVVTAGEGRACTDGGEPHVIAAGDVVWIPAGERHWHGAAPDTFMSHMAISIGDHDWQEPVADEQYGLRRRAAQPRRTTPVCVVVAVRPPATAVIRTA